MQYIVRSEIMEIKIDDYTGRPADRQLAECTGADPDIFFPTRGGSNDYAKRICATCVLIEECAEDAITNFEKGIRGGLSERERRAIRKQREEHSDIRESIVTVVT